MIQIETPVCVVCQKSSTVELEAAKFDRRQAGEHVQNVWPAKSSDERELLISGTHPACWEEIFGDEEGSSE